MRVNVTNETFFRKTEENYQNMINLTQKWISHTVMLVKVVK